MYELYHGDCLEVMPTLPDRGADAIICDPPYGTTACKWDSVIPFAPMWAELKRLIKPRGAVVLFGSQPFTSALVMSNVKWFKYEWVWEKTRPSNFFAARYMPLDSYENISVFSSGGINNGSKNPMRYHPQDIIAINRFAKNSNTGGKIGKEHKTSITNEKIYHQMTKNYPKRLLRFDNDLNTIHPTQKPLALMEYLVKTYTNPGDTVLDFTMGSGTTGHACMNTGRHFIGIEKDAAYFAIAERRIREAAEPLGAMQEVA